MKMDTKNAKNYAISFLCKHCQVAIIQRTTNYCKNINALVANLTKYQLQLFNRISIASNHLAFCAITSPIHMQGA
jgi:hypothetical protein